MRINLILIICVLFISSGCASNNSIGKSYFQRDVFYTVGDYVGPEVKEVMGQ